MHLLTYARAHTNTHIYQTPAKDTIRKNKELTKILLKLSSQFKPEQAIIIT